jgi:iron complex transport system substrate-binding protein
VKIVASFSDDAKARRPAQTLFAAFERLAQGCSGRRGLSLFAEKDPVASLSHARGRKVDGILSFKNSSIERFSLCDLCGSLCLCGRSFSQDIHHRDTEDHRGRTERYPHLFSLFVLALLFVAASCSAHRDQKPLPTSPTREVTDEAGRRVQLAFNIDRIVSLAPNLTEIVYAVGAGDRLVGRTKYCDYPAEAKSVAEIGDTMTPSIERIIALKPQLVLVSTASQLEAFTKQLDQQKIAVYVTDPHSLEEVFRSIATLGDLLGTHSRTEKLVADLRRRADATAAAVNTSKPIKVFYQISDEPLYTIGRESYLTDLVRRAGGVSVTADVPTAFPRFSGEAALAARPEAIILPTGGSMGTANSKVASALKNSPAALSGRVYKLNEDHLSRPGPRLVDGLEEMARALHPEAFK